MSEIEIKIVIRMLFAFVLGVLIGFDREKSGKAAGIRTQMLVCVGSAMLSAISIFLAEGHNTPDFGVPKADPARLMAQIVSGIGFLGAGVILKNGSNKISGLTTAATIWITAAIGISVGSGYYLSALTATGLVLLLNPIAVLQYRSGLKSNYYQLTVPYSKSKIVDKAIKFLRIQEKGRWSKNGEMSLQILSSTQKNLELSEILEQKNIQYELGTVDE